MFLTRKNEVMSTEEKDKSNVDLRISIILRGAIAVVIGVVATVLMFTKLTSTTLMVSYRQAEVSLERTPVALLPEMTYSLMIGIAAGVVALVLIFGLGRLLGDKEK
jgi:ABC-type Fe3+ transport system permease subunit